MNNEQWGNIELPGISDEELLKKDWNKVARSKENWNNPEYIKKVKEKKQQLINSPDWEQIIARRSITRRNNIDDEFRQHMSELSIEKWQDSEFRAKVTQSRKEYWSKQENHDKKSAIMQEVAKRPEVKAALKAGAERRAKDPKDLALRKEVGARNKNNPDFKIACKASVTPERKAKFAESMLKHKDPVKTPLGVFRCVTDAAKMHSVKNESIRNKIKKDKTNYYYITREEYEQLKK